MNTVQSPVFIAIGSIADKVGLRFFSSVHDPATNSSKFPGVRWFLKRLGLDVPHISDNLLTKSSKKLLKSNFFKAGILFMACNSVTKIQMTRQSDAMVTLKPSSPKPK